MIKKQDFINSVICRIIKLQTSFLRDINLLVKAEASEEPAVIIEFSQLDLFIQ